MLGDEEDVFESVAWETPVSGYTPVAETSTSAGPGFKQSTDSEEEDSNRNPHEPKWDGYLVSSVQDPIKELAETKDTYVSYLVSAKVDAVLCIFLHLSNRSSTVSDKLAYILLTQPFGTETLSRFRFPERSSLKRLSGVRCSTLA